VIAVTVETPVYRVAHEAGVACCLLTPVLSLFGWWAVGRRIRRTGARCRFGQRPRVCPKSLFGDRSARLARSRIGLLAVFGADRFLPAGQLGHFGDGQFLFRIGVIYLRLLLVAAGFPRTQIRARGIRRQDIFRPTGTTSPLCQWDR